MRNGDPYVPGACDRNKPVSCADKWGMVGVLSMSGPGLTATALRVGESTGIALGWKGICLTVRDTEY